MPGGERLPPAAPSADPGARARLLGFERRWLGVILDAALPGGADPRLPRGVAGEPGQALVDDVVRVAPAESVLALRLAVWVVYLAGPAIGLRRPRTLGGLGVADRGHVLDALSASRLYLLRELPLLLKLVAGFAYGAAPHVRRSIGIDDLCDPPDWAPGQGG